VKLLVYLDTTDAKNTRAQEAFVKQVWRECQKWDILLMIEELSYPRKGEDKDAPEYLVRKSRNILEACKLIGPYADILKLEFPGNLKSMGEAEIMDNLEALDEAAIRPWVLLSAGEKFDVFIQYVEMAMKAGSSGYMAGRAIFNEYFLQDTPAQRRQLQVEPRLPTAGFHVVVSAGMGGLLLYFPVHVLPRPDLSLPNNLACIQGMQLLLHQLNRLCMHGFGEHFFAANGRQCCRLGKIDFRDFRGSGLRLLRLHLELRRLSRGCSLRLRGAGIRQWRQSPLWFLQQGRQRPLTIQPLHLM